MRHDSLVRHLRSTAVLAALAAAPCAAQAPAAPAAPAAAAAHAAHAEAPPALRAEDAAALARLTVAIAQVRDSTQKQLSHVRNKTPEAQHRLREQAAAQVAALLKGAGMTEVEYRRRTYQVSTDAAARRVFDETVGKLSGTAAPEQTVGGTVAAAPMPPMPMTLPAGPLGTHLGHVAEAFGDTPMKRGLLPTAAAEARIAATHAALAARNQTVLEAMQTHAGHVLHAVDPAEGSTGPGLGYGVKRAALGVVAHIEMAGAAAGAPPAVATHAGHVATAARNTVERCDQIVALVRRIQAATSAADATALVGQLVWLTDELTTGRDADADARIDWKEKEGGLHQADEHLQLLLKAAGSQ